LHNRAHACGDDADRAVDQGIDVGRRTTFQRAIGGKILHPVDQCRDAINLIADQLGERRIAYRSAVPESNCAAPLMPESGFLISCARIAAAPMADRAPPDVPPMADLACARLCAWSDTTRHPSWSDDRRDHQVNGH
jgi:hypothetical protein